MEAQTFQNKSGGSLVWPQADLDTLIRLEQAALTNPGLAVILRQSLQGKNLVVIYYKKLAGGWTSMGEVPYDKYNEIIMEETKKMFASGKLHHSQYAFHPPNYHALDEFDSFMIKKYGL